MSLIFFGTGSFAIPTLRSLADSVTLVITQPDRPTGRGLKLTPSPVKQVALELGITVETPEKARAPEWVERIQALRPDALVVASYGQILSQRLLDSARIGGINLHGSILPRYRGAAPIQRAIFSGDSETGITLMQMDKGMDTGDIIHVETTEIGHDETYGELQDRLALVAAQIAVDWMPRLLGGSYSRQTQDNAFATSAPKVEKAEAEISILRDAREEYNRLKAFSPEPGPFLNTQFGILRISKARLSGEMGEPGTLLATSPLSIALRNGSIELHEVQPEGKKRMTGKDFANGARLRPGMRLV